ncbi:MAG: Uma2 family endonuclease [Kofleriaceae bacterium]|nr:Uma2 family endonuclease [Kofleriaceae bacterium]
MFDPALLAPERVRPLKRREYEELVELGVFGDERVELLRGVLVEMTPQGEPHARISAWFAQRLIKALSLARYEVRTHSPFAATDDSMPEPDVSVSLQRTDGKHPSQALLLIEVAGSSVTKDRNIKTEIYAEAGVPEYWIVNLRTDTVEVLRRPTVAGYQQKLTKRIGDVLRPLRLRGVQFEVAKIPWLPRADDAPMPRAKRRRSPRPRR